VKNKIRWVEVVVRNVEKSGKIGDGENIPNPGEYTLIVSLVLFGLWVLISTTIFSTPISQFVHALEHAIASVSR